MQQKYFTFVSLIGWSNTLRTTAINEIEYQNLSQYHLPSLHLENISFAFNKQPFCTQFSRSNKDKGIMLGV